MSLHNNCASLDVTVTGAEVQPQKWAKWEQSCTGLVGRVQAKGMAALGSGPPPGRVVAREAGLVCSETGLIHLVVDETSRHQGAVICFHSNKSHRYDSSPPMHEFLKCISYDSTKRILFQTQRNFIF